MLISLLGDNELLHNMVLLLCLLNVHYGCVIEPFLIIDCMIWRLNQSTISAMIAAKPHPHFDITLGLPC